LRRGRAGVERSDVVKHSQDDCARLERLLARMEDASGAPAHRADPTDALTPDDLAWAEAHVDACVRCAAGASSDAALVAGALRSAADALPDEGFFAERRAAILAAITAQDVAPAPAPAAMPARRLVAARSTADAAQREPRVARRARRFAPRRRSALPFAVAAMLVVGLTSALLLSRREPELARGPGAAGDAVVAVAPLEESRSIDDADDSWLVASNDLFAAELAEPAESAVDPLAALSDEELDEIEDVFLAAPGWS